MCSRGSDEYSVDGIPVFPRRQLIGFDRNARGQLKQHDVRMSQGILNPLERRNSQRQASAIY